MPGPRAQRDEVVRVKQEDIARREDGAMPVDVDSFLLVGRKAVKTVGGRKVQGVIRMWTPTFGAGRQHDGLRVRYHPNPLKKERPEDAQPMDTDFTFYVAWEGSDELEELSLEEAQAVATQEWCDDVLPDALRKLVKGGADGGFDWDLWETLDGAKAAQIYLGECEAAERKERSKRQAAATRAANKAKAAGEKEGGKAAATPRVTAKRAGGAPGRKAGATTAKKPAEPAPLRAPQGVADAFQLRAAEKRKRQQEARAALAAAAASGQPVAPSPAKKARVLGDLAPRPCASPAAAQTAAAAARVVPSGQGSPSSRGAGASAPNRRKAQPVTATASDSVADSSSRQRRQEAAAEAAAQAEQRAAQDSERQRVAAGRAAARAPSTTGRAKQQTLSPSTAGRGKQQVLSPTKSGKSRGSGRSSGGKAALPAVLRQQEQEAVAPADSARLRQEEARSMKVERPLEDVVFWYDRVETQDGRQFRAYCRHLILPEGACLRSKDRKMRSWKGKEQDADADFDVERLLAEREGEDGEARYLVKWTGYEADPAPESWLDEGALADSQAKLQDWRARGRAEWLAASKAVLREAGIERS